MIHTTDLMLGNWVEYATGINKDKRSIPMQVTGIFSDTVYLDFEGNEGDVFEEEEENLLGIPITDELLKVVYAKCDKIGEFSYIQENGYWIYLNIFITNEIRTTISLYKTDNMCDVSVLEYNGSEFGGDKIILEANDLQYLHQLQNAYFMLTGKRLEVRL